MDAVANQYAALPSLHMAWSLWSAVAVLRCSSNMYARRIIWLYAAGTLFVILGTGNRWLFDAVAGPSSCASGSWSPVPRFPTGVHRT